MRGLTRLLAGECGASSRPALSVDSGRTIAFDRGVADERDEQHRQYDEASPWEWWGEGHAEQQCETERTTEARKNDLACTAFEKHPAEDPERQAR